MNSCKGEDSSQGDSGSPLVIPGKKSDQSDDIQVVVNVVSWGTGFESPDFPGVYAQMNKSDHWIVPEICFCSFAPPVTLYDESSDAGSSIFLTFDNSEKSHDDAVHDAFPPSLPAAHDDSIG